MRAELQHSELLFHRSSESTLPPIPIGGNHQHIRQLPHLGDGRHLGIERRQRIPDAIFEDTLLAAGGLQEAVHCRSMIVQPGRDSRVVFRPPRPVPRSIAPVDPHVGLVGVPRAPDPADILVDHRRVFSIRHMMLGEERLRLRIERVRPPAGGIVRQEDPDRRGQRDLPDGGPEVPSRPARNRQGPQQKDRAQGQHLPGYVESDAPRQEDREQGDPHPS